MIRVLLITVDYSIKSLAIDIPVGYNQCIMKVKRRSYFAWVVVVLLLIITVGVWYCHSDSFLLRSLVTLPNQADKLASLPPADLSSGSLAIFAHHPVIAAEPALYPVAKTLVTHAYLDLNESEKQSLLQKQDTTTALQALAAGEIDLALISEPHPEDLARASAKSQVHLQLLAKDAVVFLAPQKQALSNLTISQAVAKMSSNRWQAYQWLDENERQTYRLLSVANIYPSWESIQSDNYPLVVNIYAAYTKADNIYVQQVRDFFLSVQGQKLFGDYKFVSINR